MITKEQAIELGNKGGWIHAGKCSKTVGPRGGVKVSIEQWHVNGKCKTWKTMPDRFQLPIKFGLRLGSYVTESNCQIFHLETDCEVSR